MHMFVELSRIQEEIKWQSVTFSLIPLYLAFLAFCACEWRACAGVATAGQIEISDALLAVSAHVSAWRVGWRVAVDALPLHSEVGLKSSV